MTSHFFRTCLETQNRPNYWYARWFFWLVFTAPAKLEVELRAKIGHYRNRSFGNGWSQQGEYLQVLNRTEPCVRRVERPLLACHNRRNVVLHAFRFIWLSLWSRSTIHGGHNWQNVRHKPNKLLNNLHVLPSTFAVISMKSSKMISLIGGMASWYL